MSVGSALTWRWVGFDSLSPKSLYALLQLRSAVFVVEQNCAFQDLDGFDEQAVHLLGERGVGGQADRGGATGELLAYARCFGPGVKYTEASIGRVITHANLRGAGAGHVLMRQAIACCQAHWGQVPIRIGAQARLQAFYTQHGFVREGAVYLEDGIDHIEMLRL